jgi:hypothetical protein
LNVFEMSLLLSLGRTARWQLLYGMILGAIVTSSLVSYYQSRRRQLLGVQPDSDSDIVQLRDGGVTSGLEGLIGLFDYRLLLSFHAGNALLATRQYPFGSNHVLEQCNGH